MPITIVLADDSEVVRRGIRQLLEKQADLEVVGEAACFAELNRRLKLPWRLARLKVNVGNIFHRQDRFEEAPLGTAPALAELPLPLTLHGSVMIAPQVDQQDHHANKHSAANDEPLRQVGIYDCIEEMHQKRSVYGFDARADFKPRFGHCERARRPRNQLNGDGVDE